MPLFKRTIKEEPKNKKMQRDLVVLIALLGSVLFHVLFILCIYFISKNYDTSTRPPIKVKLVYNQLPKPLHSEEKKDDELKSLVETPLTPTKEPEKANYMGVNNHETEKETKTKLKDHDKHKVAGVQGNANNSVVAEASEKKQNEQKKKENKQQEKHEAAVTLQANGKPAKQPKKNKSKSEMTDFAPRNPYEEFMNSNLSQLKGQIDAGYQDYITDQIDEGEVIDLNTKEYRYIGYFSNLKHSIELAWIYPSQAARRGIHGRVIVRFTIDKEGRATRVAVLNTSGHKVLDDAIIEAIHLASPFAPLPDGFNKKNLIVTGAFDYILSSF